MKLVTIDAGHGGHDGGAYGAYSKEKDVALTVSKLVSKYLLPYVDTFLTREDDTFLSLSTRPDLSNSKGADAFISIHCNAADNTSASGWEIFTTPSQNNSDKLATAIGESYGAANPNMKSRLDFSDGDLDKEANFTVIKGTNCPSCLLELGFISNEAEEGVLNDPQYQEDAAKAIAHGVLDYLGITIDGGQVEAEPLTVEQRLDDIEARLDAANI